jgi:hypothetical protein
MSKNTAREEVGGKVECSGVCCDVAAVAPVGIAALLPGVVLGSRVGVGIIDERRGAGWRWYASSTLVVVVVLEVAAAIGAFVCAGGILISGVIGGSHAAHAVFAAARTLFILSNLSALTHATTCAR